jgi:archaellum component FlaC
MNKHMKEMNAQLNNLMKKQKDAQSLVEIVNEKIFHLKSDRR